MIREDSDGSPLAFQDTSATTSKRCDRGGSNGTQYPDGLFKMSGAQNLVTPAAAALSSKSGRARDTRLVAKAKGPLAAELLEIAKAHEIPIHSDADLVEILVALEEDAEIPLEALATVAEILNYLYEAQRVDGREEFPENRP